MAENDEETTLDLDQAMVDGMEKFQGELIEAAREGTEDGGQETEDGEDPQSAIRAPQSEAITPKPDDQDSPPKKEKEDPAGTDTPDGKKDKEDTAGTKGKDEGRRTKDEGEPPDEKKTQFRFKDQEEAETGYRHIQAKASRAEQEAARLRAELKTAQDAEEQREVQEKNDKDLLDFMTEEHEKALVKIDELDPDDEGYRKKVSRIWAEKDSTVDIKRRAQARPPRLSESDGGQGAEGTAEGEETPGENKIWEAVEERAKAAKIDPDDDYFRMACSFTPTEGPDGQKLSFEEQTDFAIQQTKEYHIKQEQRFQDSQREAAAKKSELHQEENLPLGRSAADRSGDKPPEPKVVTLNDALEDAMGERVL